MRAIGEREMRRRTRHCNPWRPEEAQWSAAEQARPRKRSRRFFAEDAAFGCDPADEIPDFFDGLPDDLVLIILSKFIASATRPSDLLSVMLISKRMNQLVTNPLVLAKASAESVAVRARNWSESAHRFLNLCVDAGNLEACYILGMINFYCLRDLQRGASLMARAAMGSHAAALYALAIIKFNGSGGTKSHKDLRAGVALCARAAYLGLLDAIRELGHCLQDGYGVSRNVAAGRRFLIYANTLELNTVLHSTSAAAWQHRPFIDLLASGCPLLSDFGYNVPALEPHPANRFLVEWFTTKGASGELSSKEGVRLCSHTACGRSEMRWHEFRRCSVCNVVNYCSRTCQALHWRTAHKFECSAPAWIHRVPAAEAPPDDALIG